MSHVHQFFSVNHREFIHLLQNSAADEMTERVVRAVGNEFEWPQEVMQNTTIREACVNIFDKHEYHCRENGFVYFGLMLLCDHERLPADGWKSQYSEDVAEYVNDTDVSPNVKEIFAGLARGRDPFFKVMSVGYQDVIACFIRADEPKMLVASIEACSDFAGGKIPNRDVEEIIFNEFLPAIDVELSNDHCLAIFTL